MDDPRAIVNLCLNLSLTRANATVRIPEYAGDLGTTMTSPLNLPDALEPSASPNVVVEMTIMMMMMATVLVMHENQLTDMIPVTEATSPMVEDGDVTMIGLMIADEVVEVQAHIVEMMAMHLTVAIIVTVSETEGRIEDATSTPTVIDVIAAATKETVTTAEAARKAASAWTTSANSTNRVKNITRPSLP